MKIITPAHKITSQKVKNLQEIVGDMNEMMKMVKDLATPYGVLHHSQISKKPYDFFVITPVLRPIFKHNWIMCNTKILSFTNRKEVLEHCSSYPDRKPKKIVRYTKIKVSCLVENPGLLGELSEEEMELQGMAALLVQHQLDHAQGRRLYDK